MDKCHRLEVRPLLPVVGNLANCGSLNLEGTVAYYPGEGHSCNWQALFDQRFCDCAGEHSSWNGVLPHELPMIQFLLMKSYIVRRMNATQASDSARDDRGILFIP